MKLTAKRLSELTAVPVANIRKWRERYGVLTPERGDNGYLYYTSEDYRLLLAIKNLLAKGMKISHIMRKGREILLEQIPTTHYRYEDMAFLEKVIDNRFSDLAHELNATYRTNDLAYLINKVIHPQVVLVGQAWEAGLITVAAEHAYSRWLMGYLHQLTYKYYPSTKQTSLFISFPGDEHELGAMMHFALMATEGQGGRFSGALPIDRLSEELGAGKYEELHVSVTIPKPRSEIKKFINRIYTLDKRIKIKIGGSGIESREELK
ncbi:MAG TPA: MerR family transcriptional regulator [Turneriella sp.]|nr:MerR family transcriptional regulator [Turneriella sp.]